MTRAPMRNRTSESVVYITKRALQRAVKNARRRALSNVYHNFLFNRDTLKRRHSDGNVCTPTSWRRRHADINAGTPACRREHVGTPTYWRKTVGTPTSWRKAVGTPTQASTRRHADVLATSGFRRIANAFKFTHGSLPPPHDLRFAKRGILSTLWLARFPCWLVSCSNGCCVVINRQVSA